MPMESAEQATPAGTFPVRLELEHRRSDEKAIGRGGCEPQACDIRASQLPPACRPAPRARPPHGRPPRRRRGHREVADDMTEIVAGEKTTTWKTREFRRELDRPSSVVFASPPHCAAVGWARGGMPRTVVEGAQQHAIIIGLKALRISRNGLLS